MRVGETDKRPTASVMRRRETKSEGAQLVEGVDSGLSQTRPQVK